MKTAVSIPDPLFREADLLAERLGISRSEFYARALARVLEAESDDAVTAALDRVYGATESRLDGTIARAQQRAVHETW